MQADVQPRWARLLIKGRLLQLRLPCDVLPDESAAQRSRASGRLVLVMPKADAACKELDLGCVRPRQGAQRRGAPQCMRAHHPMRAIVVNFGIGCSVACRVESTIIGHRGHQLGTSRWQCGCKQDMHAGGQARGSLCKPQRPPASAEPIASNDHTKLDERAPAIDIAGITKQRPLKATDVNIKAIRKAPLVQCAASDDEDIIPPL